jgi:hypothetical protein
MCNLDSYCSNLPWKGQFTVKYFVAAHYFFNWVKLNEGSIFKLISEKKSDQAMEIPFG